MIQCKTVYQKEEVKNDERAVYTTRYAYTVPEYIAKLKSEVWKDTKQTPGYCTSFGCFDIESTTVQANKIKSDVKIKEDYTAYMYCWQYCERGNVIFGNTWGEYLALLLALCDFYHINKNNKMVIYVHNLSYEYQFLYSFVNFTRVFATKKRKVLKATQNEMIEYRCSYLLTGYNLAKAISNTPGAMYQKAKGDLDYRKIYTSGDDMNDKEQGYRYNDVRGLYEVIQDKLKDDDLATIPLTNTAYIRRKRRDKMRENPKNRDMFLKTRLHEDTYKLCKQAFRGGNTASNRYRTGEIQENVQCYDIRSSYPYVMLSQKYPIGAFMHTNIDSREKLERYNENYRTLGQYIMVDIKLKKNIPIPYLPFAKRQKITKPKCYNGRILSCDFLEITLTEIDWDIIKKQYDFELCRVDKFYYRTKDFLPREYRDFIYDLFEKKSKLKPVSKQYPIEYQKAKGELNSTYGMTVTDPLHDDLYFDDDTGEWVLTPETDIEQALDKYYNSRNHFLPYQWGVWITRYARLQLQKGIDRVGMDLIYTDTDSLKVVGDHVSDIEKINAEINEYCKENGIKNWCEVDGNILYVGPFDRDDDDEQFVTLGAKKYAVKSEGKIEVTVAGLNKKKGRAEIEKLGGLEFFREGVIFEDSGRTVAYYENYPVHTIEVNGKKIITGSCIAIIDTTYTLGVTREMNEILENLRKEKENDRR